MAIKIFGLILVISIVFMEAVKCQVEPPIYLNLGNLKPRTAEYRKIRKALNMLPSFLISTGKSIRTLLNDVMPLNGAMPLNAGTGPILLSGKKEKGVLKLKDEIRMFMKNMAPIADVLETLESRN